MAGSGGRIAPDGPMIALTFALPDESRALVASLAGRRSRLTDGNHLPVITGQWRGRPVSVIHTGVGENAPYRRRLEWLLATETPRLLISGGYAGGLQPAAAVGDLVLGENVSHPDLLGRACELLPADRPPLHIGALVTRSAMAETVEAKRELGAGTGAVAVDMETAWIAAACAAAGVPMLSLRAISDAVEHAFPVPGHILFDARRQHPRYVALPLWLLRHPGRVRSFVRFVRGVRVAQTHLTAALQVLVDGL